MEKSYTITLTKRQVKLLGMFLDKLDEHYSNAGCNDLPEEFIQLFSEDEGIRIAAEFAIYNNPKHPDGPIWPIPDGCLLYWLKRKITDQIK